MKGLAGDLARLSPQQRAALETLLWQRRTPRPPAGAPEETIVRGSRNGDSVPLSFAQQRLWFIDQLTPGSAAYNTATAMVAQGAFSPAIFARALTEVVRRHEVLRTVFHVGGDLERGPVQVIREPRPVDLPRIDLTAVELGMREAEVQRLAVAEAGQAFDLAHGPLWRATLLVQEPEQHVLLFTLHHVICDAWSMGVLVREVNALYEAFRQGRPNPLPDLPIQYADFALWQRQQLSGDKLARELGYWRERLAGAPALLDLPVDRPRPPVQSFRGSSEAQRFEGEVAESLRALSQSAGATLYMTLLAAFSALLARYSGQLDINVGMPIAGRNRRETEGLIGFFVNTLVLRHDLRGDPGFHEMLERVRQVVLAGLAHSDLPFEMLVGDLQPERSLSSEPLFQVVANFHYLPNEDTLAPSSLRWRSLEVAQDQVHFDLILSGMEERGGLRVTLEYRTDLFDLATVCRMLGHLATLLGEAVREPEIRLSDLPLLTASEREELRVEWEGELQPSANTPCLLRLFEAQARRAPGAPALVLGVEALTYGELDHQADRLARRLQALGVGPEVVVGICLERSLALVVAILGVVKAGGAYLPLDPAYPPQRLAWLLADAGALLVVTERRFSDILPKHGARLVHLDEAGEWSDGDGPVESGVIPGNLAYVIYTSGSTGQPRGVHVTHANVGRLLAATDAWFGFGSRDVWTLFHSFAFDFSVWEIWGALAYGGSLVVVPSWVSRSPELFYQLLGEEKVTVLNQTPSAFRQLMRAEEEGGGGQDLALRLVIFGGEALEMQSLRPWVARHGAVKPRLVNMYGITETTVHVTYRPLAEADVLGSGGSLIGRAIPDLGLRVLDRGLAPQPVGVPGELCVAGAGLARGYLSRPELTAERFIPDPWGSAGSRLYRSGDLVRRLPAGDVEYLGRIDHQVKVRGFRIELGEIETAILGAAGESRVREVVVLVREDEPGDRRLVAYVVGDIAADALRQSLQERLPDYMVPALFVELPALPLTPNGKVDRKALPAPEWQPAEETYLAPRTPVEELIAGIWEEVLKVERVGAADHFFNLGGHSLLAAQVMSRLRQALEIELPLRDLFEAPTLADLAARVEVARRVDTGVVAPPLGAIVDAIAPPLRDRPLPLSSAQQRLWFLDQLKPGTSLYNMPVALRVEGPLRRAVLALCLEEIVRRHEALRTVFVAQEGGPAQWIQPATAFPLPLVDLSGLPESRGEALALTLTAEEADRPFDLARGPLLRGVLLRLDHEDHVAALSMHHIVSDGWSLGILVREVAALYAAFAEGRPSPLPELPVQYADFALWQGSWLRGEILEREIAFWRRQLAGLPSRLDLPTDRPRPAVQSFRGASRTVRLPTDLVRRVGSLSRREGSTPFMVLLAGFQVLLSRYSGQQDLAVGTPVAGRNQVELEGLIGFFVNTLVLRADLTGNPTFRELLGQVRETALAAHAHQNVPFEKLVQELAPERSLAQSPLFQVMLALQNASVEALEIQDLRLRPAGPAGDGARAMAKFDLTLNLDEQDGDLRGGMEYATDLFDAATLDRLIGHWQRMLEEAVTRPDWMASRLRILSLAEYGQLLREWNDSRVPKLTQNCLHHQVAAQAARTPSAVALEMGGERWTYRRLIQSARHLARDLRRLGVGPDVIVGVGTERSPAVVVGMLAVLEAGGAYLPLDPTYPRERLAFMLADSKARVLLIQEHLQGQVPALDCRVVLLDQRWESRWESRLESDAEIGETPGVEVPPDHLAYVLYTSGSTGQPKGVMVQHRAVARYLDWAVRAYGVETGRGASVHSSLAFDLTVTSLWAPLLTGRTVTLLPEQDGVEALASSVCSEADLSFVKLTPSHLDLLAQQVSPEAVRGWTRALVVGGDAVRRESLAFWREHAPRTRIYNEYGPTETVVGCSVHEAPAGVSAAGSLPIGRPIDGTHLHVVDPEVQLVPVGVAGELLIGGEGVARGYLRRPDLTGERFVPDPFSGDSGGRLYRTGDLVRRLPDGDLDFLGRIDHQVKVRGFRIEPGEIEAELAALSGVSQAVVTLREDAPGDPRLVAYVASDVSADTLRRSLRERLPDYMVPSVFVILETLPLTPNGKVDRKALRAPEWQSAAPGYLAPRTPVEEVIAGIWEELLKVERVGAQDNFFDLGGHSLLATRLVSRINSVFGGALSIRQVFDQPTVAGLAEIAFASGQNLALSILPAPRDHDFPLAFPQLRLWFLDQLEPGSPAYNVPTAVRLRGPLRFAVLEAVLTEIVRRHEALRTVFRGAPAGEPVQIITPAVAVVLPRIDLTGLPEPRREQELHRQAREEAWRPFDLGEGPLLRVGLVLLDEDEHAAFLTLHHIIGDGWSSTVLVRELGILYNAFARGQASPLAELPLQYVDFAWWQRHWLAGDVLASEIAFWKRQLGGIPPALALPTDRPRPALPTFRGANWPLSVPAALAGPLQALARRRGATLFMTLLAGLQGLLGRMSDQESFAIGSPIAGRNHFQTEDLIGFFVNMLVLRADLSGEPRSDELVARVRETALAAYAHQDMPFEKLVEELQPARRMNHSPLFQVVLVLQNLPSPAPSIPGLLFAPFPVESGTAKFDLALILGATDDGGLSGVLEYSLDLFDAATVERLAAHLQTLLAGLAADPERRLSELPLFSEGEQRQLLASWTGPRPEPPWTVPVQDLFTRAAERNPDAIALLFAGESVSYGALRRRASSLAAHLALLGVGPETRVALAVSPSPEMIVGLLGILGAGGAYVPLDPMAPPERLAHLLADAGTPVVLTQERHRDAFAARGAGVVYLDVPLPAGGSAAPRPGGTVFPESAAYVIYTSGSTGAPKGVVAPYGGLASFTRAMAEALRLGPGDRVLQFAALSFDASAVQIFPALASGAALVLHPQPRSLSLSEILDLCARTEVTVLDLPAALWRQWLAALPEEALSQATIRAYLTGGEAVPTAVLRDWATRVAPGTTFLSSYGPTEATITTTTFQTAREEVAKIAGVASAEVPLGRPLPNTRLALLDRHGQAPPHGTPGEIHIGGIGVTRGYLHRPDLTAERFVPDPLSGEPGARLYRTGDLARLRSILELEFLGRSDHQVKIRGHRIELGEVEVALAACAGVRDAVVTVQDESSGDRRLIAWVMPEAGAELLEEELLATLGTTLPPYMVPSRAVVLSELPFNTSGKVDRTALSRREIPSARRWADREPVPPRNVTELALAQAFEELLGVPVGVEDDFFELGGHSLLSVRLMALIRLRFGRDLPLADLFTYPTVAALALRLGQEGGDSWSPLVPVQARGTQAPLFCIHPVWGEVLCYYQLARRLGEDRPLYGLQARPLRSETAAEQVTVEELATEYLEAVRSLRPAGPYLLAGFSFGGIVAFEMARQLVAASEEVALLAILDAAVPAGDEAVALDAEEMIADLLREQTRNQGRTLTLDMDALRGLPLEDQLARAVAMLGGPEALGPGVDFALLRRTVLGYISRVAAVERYRTAAYPGRVTLFRARDVAPAELRDATPHRLRVLADPSLGWDHVAAGGVEIHTVPGLHKDLLAVPGVEVLAEILRACIGEAESLRDEVLEPLNATQRGDAR
ncbi:MAG TPA: amino acid adenylation domain-containing protein [Thermoanaerobaculia bacterium]|nr:amino acid adenylation domain-containing protein [Thermoanaerobaculia bacterium]